MTRQVFAAGVSYFCVTFVAGFVLGTLRVLVLTPRVGELWAVLIELPVMMAVAFVVARWLVGRFGVPPRLGPRAAMGAVAFTLLMLAEFGLGATLFQRAVAAQIAALGTLPGALGLAGQVVFGVMPLLVRRA